MKTKQNEKRLVDANVILRFLLKDDLSLYKKAAETFERAERGEDSLVVESLVVGEVVWVLRATYKISREKISRSVTQLLSEKYVSCDDKVRLLNSLKYFGESNLGFADCWLLAGVEKFGWGLESFDNKLKKSLIK